MQGYLDGSAPPATICDEHGNLVSNPDFLIFDMNDSALASWLLATVSPNILPELVGAETSVQIWKKLCQLFSDKSQSKVLYYRNLLSSQKKGDLSMREYLAKMKSICDHLAVLGESVDESHQISHILNGLTAEFESVIAVINAGLGHGVKYDLTTVSTMLLDSEARQRTFIHQTTAHAHLVHPSDLEPSDASVDYAFHVQAPFNPTSYGSRGIRPIFGQGRGRGSASFNSYTNGKPSCQLCHRVGHTVERCFYRYDLNFANGPGSIQPRAYAASYTSPPSAYAANYTSPPSIPAPAYYTNSVVPYGTYSGLSSYHPSVLNYHPAPADGPYGGSASYPSFMPPSLPGSSAGVMTSTAVPVSSPASTMPSSSTSSAQAYVVASPTVVPDSSWYLDSGAT